MRALVTQTLHNSSYKCSHWSWRQLDSATERLRDLLVFSAIPTFPTSYVPILVWGLELKKWPSGGRWYAPKCVTPGVSAWGHRFSISISILWHFTFYDILHFMTSGISWHLTFHDSWHFMTLDISWHLTFHDILLLKFHDIWQFITFAISWHFMTFYILHFMTFYIS